MLVLKRKIFNFTIKTIGTVCIFAVLIAIVMLQSEYLLLYVSPKSGKKLLQISSTHWSERTKHWS